MMTATKRTIEDVKSLAKAADLTHDMVQAVRESLDMTVGNLCIGMACEYTVEDVEGGGEADEAFSDLARMKASLDKLFLYLSKANQIAKKLEEEGYGC
jgi:hypothetical protein